MYVLLFQNGDISVFETNIRYVGGLLSAFALTGDNLFRDKAAHVADKLLPAFKSPTGIPFALINMRTGVSSIQISIHFKINPNKYGKTGIKKFDDRERCQTFKAEKYYKENI